MPRYLSRCWWIAGLLASGAAVGAEPAAAFTPTAVDSAPNRDAGLRAFAQIEKVLLHPRCLNCHVPNGPLQGEKMRIHYPPVQRGADGMGVAPMRCATCHSTQNGVLIHSPPGLETNGAPGWHMPPAHMKMSWLGLSGSALCKVFRDPKTNGNRSLAAIEQHLVTDHLVAWGWSPGPARQLPPLAKPAFDEQVRLWIRNGAPCDEKEPLLRSSGLTRDQADRQLAGTLRTLARGSVKNSAQIPARD
jgi:mono/diheme cytochrome c family protein